MILILEIFFRKTIEKALDQSGLPSGKGDEISMAKFSFEEFQVPTSFLLPLFPLDLLPPAPFFLPHALMTPYPCLSSDPSSNTQTFYKSLLGRPEVSTVFSKFCGVENQRKVMTSKEFLAFLNNSQVYSQYVPSNF